MLSDSAEPGPLPTSQHCRTLAFLLVLKTRYYIKQDMAIVGFGALEPFIGAEEGVALIAHNGKYWSVIEREKIYNIESSKTRKDKWCKFTIEKIGGNRVYLKDKRGIYLSRVNRGDVHFIEAAKNAADICCQFEVFSKEGKVLFQCDNGLFLSLTDRSNLNIEAAKEGYDEYCEFTPTCGEIINPSFKILSVDFKSLSEVQYKPTVVKEQIYRNNSSVAQKHTFNMGWTTTVTETTTWQHSWGLNASLSFSFLFVSAEISVSYSGSYSHTVTKEKSITMSSDTEFTIPPKSKATAKLIVYTEENASIPFTAKIQKTKSNGQEQILTENGTWKGVMYEKVYIDIEEEKI